MWCCSCVRTSADQSCAIWGFMPEAWCFRDVHPILMKAMSQERLQGVSSSYVQMSNWTREWPDEILLAKGCDLMFVFFLWTRYLNNVLREFLLIKSQPPLQLKNELIRTLQLWCCS